VPNIKSAEKRVSVIEKKNLQNRMVRSQMSTAIKKLNAAIDDNDMALADKLLPDVISTIDKAVAKGIIHSNNAARKKSVIQTKLNGVKSGEIIITKKLDNKTIAAQKAKAAKEAREAARAEAQAKAAAKAAEKAALDPKNKKAKAKVAAVKDKEVKAEKPVKEKAVKEKVERPVKEANPKAPAAKTAKAKVEKETVAEVAPESAE